MSMERHWSSGELVGVANALSDMRKSGIPSTLEEQVRVVLHVAIREGLVILPSETEAPSPPTMAHSVLVAGYFSYNQDPGQSFAFTYHNVSTPDAIAAAIADARRIFVTGNVDVHIEKVYVSN